MCKKAGISLLASILIVIIVGCTRSASDNLLTASQLVEQRPDSAYILLKEIDYNSLEDSGDKALFGLVHARANINMGLSLVSDTVLPDAIKYYTETGDTASMIDASVDYARHLRAIDKNNEAFSFIDSLTHVMPDSIRMELNQHLLDFAFTDKNFEKALEIIDRQILLAQDDGERFEFEIKKITPLMSLDRNSEAVALCDSIFLLPSAPEPGSRRWIYLRINYAGALGARRETALEAAYILEDVLQRMGDVPTDALPEFYIPMVNLYLNAGKLNEAERYLSKIEATGIDLAKQDVVAASYLDILKLAVDYEKSGAISLSRISNVAHSLRKVSRDLEVKKQERDTALDAAYDLSRNNYELTIKNQRLLLIFLLTIFTACIGVMIFWYISYRRRKKLIEAEDRIETLEHLLQSVNNPATDKKQGLLRRLLLQQLGIMKTFAESPTEQNQEALRKISNIGNSDKPIDSLVKWDDLFPVIDELYDNFNSNIRSNYPGLFSEREIQIVCLLRAGFSTKEIGVLIQQTSNSIYVSKTSIRKKLGLQQKEDFMALFTHQSPDVSES